MKPSDYYDEVYLGTKYRDLARLRAIAAHCQGHVLDLGCGIGELCKYHDGPYTGVDFSPVAISMAHRHFAAPARRFFCLDFLREPLPEGPFETLVLAEVLEHITEEAEAGLWPKALAELDSDATIIVTVPNGDSISEESHIRVFEESGLRKSLSGHGHVELVSYRPSHLLATVGLE